MTQNSQVLKIVEAALASPIQPLTLETKISPDSIDQSRFVGRVEKLDDGNLALELDVLYGVVPESESIDRVLQLQPLLRPHGYLAATTAHSFKDFCHIFKLGVVAAGEQYGDKAMLVFFAAPNASSLIYVRQTNGANFDVMPQDIVKQLDAWKQISDFSVLGAGFDWLELNFQRLPADLRAFAEEVYKFCPDTLDQGIVKELPEKLQRIEEPSEEDLEAMMEWMEESLDEQTPNDLAEHLERTKRLWLWWD